MKSGAALLALIAAIAATPAQANPTSVGALSEQAAAPAIPVQLNERDRIVYRNIFRAIRSEQWAEARALIASAPDSRLRPVALAELYLAKNSPRVELFDLLDLLNQAPALPQAERLSRLAQKRGAQMLPSLPQVQKLAWFPGAPRRQVTATIREDLAAQTLVAQIQPFIKNDDPAGAEALLSAGEVGLSPDALTELRQRVAWSYYIENDDANARRMADKALQGGSGRWLSQAYWVAGLAAWRQNDCNAAAAAFENTASRAEDEDMRAAGYYWAGRSHMVCGNAARVQGLTRSAARLDETFYGLLAGEALAIQSPVKTLNPGFDAEDWSRLKHNRNVQTSIALVEIGETALADEVLRHQARIGGLNEHDSLLRLARDLSLPETQIWLAHNAPQGQRPDAYARYPMADGASIAHWFSPMPCRNPTSAHRWSAPLAHAG